MRKDFADKHARLSKPPSAELNKRNRESGLPSVVRVYSEELDTTNVSPSTAWVEFVDGVPRFVSLGQDGTFYELGPSGTQLAEDIVTEVSVTGDTTLTSDAFGKLHVCSGTSANYTVVLPPTAGNAGRKIGFEMDPGLTKLVTLDGNASELIDNALTRAMWEQEVAWLKVNAAGTAWTKMAGKTRPMMALMTPSAAQSIPASIDTKINVDTIQFDNGRLTDTTNHQINILRSGVYDVLGGMAFTVGQVFPRAQAQIRVNGVFSFGGEASAYASTVIPAPQAVRPIVLTAGDVVSLWARHEAANANTAATFRLAVEERPSW